MRNLLSHTFVSIWTYAICVATFPAPFWAAPLIVITAVMLWLIGSVVARRQYRYITDTDSLQNGECPACRSNAIVEVTSERFAEESRRVVCRHCNEIYEITLQGNRIVTERLGKGPQS